MDFQFENPPQLELGQPIGYYNERFNKDLYDSSFMEVSALWVALLWATPNAW